MNSRSEANASSQKITPVFFECSDNTWTLVSRDLTKPKIVLTKRSKGVPPIWLVPRTVSAVINVQKLERIRENYLPWETPMLESVARACWSEILWSLAPLSLSEFLLQRKSDWIGTIPFGRSKLERPRDWRNSIVQYQLHASLTRVLWQAC